MGTIRLERLVWNIIRRCKLRITYTQYKNSVLATMIDVIGSGFCALSVLIVVMAFMETMQGNQGIQADDIIGLIISCATFFLLGIGLKKLAGIIAVRKAKKELEGK